ncbi:hypothetical protein AKJ09_04264 [Labilithrix luteola]|uniref:Uncharacterized protein n=1 Tax=Labilithrix luteola TaxID=1391654 RepID=A0A0K1PVP3_9BACT|nr:hypothetical protein AKJ09_04264 [Labilithrix luteola]
MNALGPAHARADDRSERERRSARWLARSSAERVGRLAASVGADEVGLTGGARCLAGLTDFPQNSTDAGPASAIRFAPHAAGAFVAPCARVSLTKASTGGRRAVARLVRAGLATNEARSAKLTIARGALGLPGAGQTPTDTVDAGQIELTSGRAGLVEQACRDRPTRLVRAGQPHFASCRVVA